MKQMTQEEFETYTRDDFDKERGEYDFLQISPVMNANWGGLYLAVREEAIKKVRKALLREDPMFSCFSIEDLAGNFPGFKAAPDSGFFLNINCTDDRCYYGYANMYRKIKELAVFLKDCQFMIVENYSYWLDEYSIINGKLLFLRTLYDNNHLDNDLFSVMIRDKPEDGPLQYAVATDVLFPVQYDLESGNTLGAEHGDTIENSLKICVKNDNAWFFNGLYDLSYNRDIASATQSFGNALRLAPESLYAAIGCAMVAMQEGNWRQCLVHVDNALGRSESAELLLLKGYANHMLEVPAQTQDAFRRIRESGDKLPFSLEMLNILRHGNVLWPLIWCFWKANRRVGSENEALKKSILETMTRLAFCLKELAVTEPLLEELFNWLDENKR